MTPIQETVGVRREKKADDLAQKINSLLSSKVDELSRLIGEDITAKDIDVIIKLVNLKDKVSGGRPVLSVSVTVMEELLSFLDESDSEMKMRIEERLPEFFARLRENYE